MFGAVDQRESLSYEIPYMKLQTHSVILSACVTDREVEKVKLVNFSFMVLHAWVECACFGIKE